jgi:hypothetical protein
MFLGSMLVVILQEDIFEKVAIKVVSTQDYVYFDLFAPQKITKLGKVISKEGSKSRKRKKEPGRCK